MREFSTPLTTHVVATGNLTDDVVTAARETGSKVLFSRRGPGGWVDVTAAEFQDQVVAVAKGLVAAGVGAGERVVLLSKTRYEWTLLDYAIWFAGAVSVPVYDSASTDELRWILQDSGARAAVVENPRHVARVHQARCGEDQDEMHLVWTIEDGAVEVLSVLGAAVPDDELEQRRTAAGPADLATLIYTSGTTGTPKGCMLTHGNFMHELGVAVEELAELFEPEDAATLLVLPLPHVFARIIQVGAVRSRTRLGHTSAVTDLSRDLREFRPTFVLAVPRVFEKIFTTAALNATADGRGKVFDRGARVAIAWSRALDSGRVPVSLRMQHALFERTVYARLRTELGGRCRYAVSGGAPLGERLGHFFRGIGVNVLEGYGLTETTGALTVNVPGVQRIGTVGRPLPGTAVRVDEVGELVVAGGQVFAGYWRDDQATAAVVGPDGWLRTGDVGEVDEDGYVRVTGRRKEIIVTAGGKHVAPAVLEDRLRAHPLVDQCLVVGDGQPFIGALVTIEQDAFAAWTQQHGKSGDLADHVADPDLLAAVQDAVDEANAVVSQAEAIRRFSVLPVEWTEEGGHLTPSLKLKRHVVLHESRGAIRALYC